MNGSPWERGEPNPVDIVPVKIGGKAGEDLAHITQTNERNYRIIMDWLDRPPLRPSATSGRVGAPFTDPWWNGMGDRRSCYPIGSTDLGPVDPLEVYRARLQNAVPAFDGSTLTSAATDDEILAAYHGQPLGRTPPAVSVATRMR